MGRSEAKLDTIVCAKVFRPDDNHWVLPLPVTIRSALPKGKPERLAKDQKAGGEIGRRPGPPRGSRPRHLPLHPALMPSFYMKSACISAAALGVRGFSCPSSGVPHLHAVQGLLLPSPSSGGRLSAGEKDFVSHHLQVFIEWAMLGSNQRPLPCEGSALPLS